MESLYGLYTRERSHCEYLEIPGKGFAVWEYFSDKNACFIREMFVVSELRKKGTGKILLEHIIEDCQEKNISEIHFTIDPKAKNFPLPAICAAKTGFKYTHFSDNLMWYSKSIKKDGD